jgi:hypothetical protein
MDYKKAWEEYKETLQQSAYMQRLTLEHDEKVFKAGFECGMQHVNSLKINR